MLVCISQGYMKPAAFIATQGKLFCVILVTCGVMSLVENRNTLLLRMHTLF